MMGREFLLTTLARRLSRRQATAAGLGVATLAPATPGLAAKRCPKRKTRCQGTCRDLRRDERHCGVCGNACGQDEICRRGICAAGPVGATPQRPFPQPPAYAGGTLFPSAGLEAMADDVRAYYDRWKRQFVIAEPRGRYRIAFGKSKKDQKVTVSEGQGYGMVIVPLLAGHDPDAQTIFDGLWQYVLDHPSTIDDRLMDWKQPYKRGNVSAFDGDADIAFGLLLADAQWGSGGAIDYRAGFERVAAGIAASTIGPNSHLPMLGDWVDPDGSAHSEWTTRSSDFMPAHFAAFAAAGASEFSAVVQACSTVTNDLQGRYASGLLPDFIVWDDTNGEWDPAPPHFLEKDTDGDYYYNAGRVPWRLGTAAVFGDTAARNQVRQLSTWAEDAHGGDPAAITPGYALDGSPLHPDWSPDAFFIAPFGVAAMSTPGQQDWLDAIYDWVHKRHQNYYPDSITLLSMLVMSGTYWAP